MFTCSDGSFVSLVIAVMNAHSYPNQWHLSSYLGYTVLYSLTEATRKSSPDNLAILENVPTV